MSNYRRTGKPNAIVKVRVGGKETCSTPRSIVAMDAILTGHNLTVLGNGNVVMGNRNYVEGNYNQVFGQENQVKGEHNLWQFNIPNNGTPPPDQKYADYRQWVREAKYKGIKIEVDGTVRRCKSRGVHSDHVLIPNKPNMLESMGVIRTGQVPVCFARKPLGEPCRVANDAPSEWK